MRKAWTSCKWFLLENSHRKSKSEEKNSTKNIEDKRKYKRKDVYYADLAITKKKDLMLQRLKYLGLSYNFKIVNPGKKVLRTVEIY